MLHISFVSQAAQRNFMMNALDLEQNRQNIESLPNQGAGVGVISN